MPKVNGHRYNIVYSSAKQRDYTLFAVYYASDDRRHNTKDTNRAFDKVYTLSQLRDFLLYFPPEINLRLRLRPRKTDKRLRHKRQAKQAKLEKIQAKLTELLNDNTM